MTTPIIASENVDSIDPLNALPNVILLGRPNVGKSTLFNRLLGKRKAVVADIAGTTRDRIKHQKKFGSHQALLVDMAGIEPALTEKNVLTEGIQRQVELALKEAAVVVWVVDALAGVTADDQRVAEILRRIHLPVIIAANKCDHPTHEMLQFEFSRYGYDKILPISALHAKGIVALEQAVGDELEKLQHAISRKERQKIEGGELALAILGRPNVGKSTLLNHLTGEERAVVSPIAGTTRDAVDTVITASSLFGRTPVPFGVVRIVDTAGIRRSGKIGHSIEAWSVLRSLDSLDRAQVVLFLVDATEHLTHQDLVVAEKVVEAGRPLIIVVNKWDLYLYARRIDKDSEAALEAQEKFQAQLLYKARMLSWCQVIFLSAETGLNIEFLGSLILRAYTSWVQLPSQEKVDELVVHLKTLPRLRTLKKIEVQRSSPPVFILHVESAEVLHFTTRRMVERALRDWLDLGPVPIKLWVERSRQKPPKHHKK